MHRKFGEIRMFGSGDMLTTLPTSSLNFWPFDPHASAVRALLKMDPFFSFWNVGISVNYENTDNFV